MKAFPLSYLLIQLLVSSYVSVASAEEQPKFPVMQRDAAGIGTIAQGNLPLPSPDQVKKVWIGFLAKDGVSRETTNRLQEVLEKAGYRVTNNKDLANLKITVAGFARIRNELDNSFDTGSVMIKDIVPSLQMDTIVYGNSTPDYHPDRPVDAAVIDGANQAILQSGGSTAGGIAGLGIAVGINMLRSLFDSSPEIKNKPFQNIVGDKGDRPLLCFDACRKTHHEVVLNFGMVPEGSLDVKYTYSLYLDKLATSADEKGMNSLANMAFDIAAKHLSTQITASGEHHE